MGSIDTKAVLGPIEHLVPANPEEVEISDDLAALALSGVSETSPPEDKSAEVAVSPALSGQSEESAQRDDTSAPLPSGRESSLKGDHSGELAQLSSQASVTGPLSQSVNPETGAVSMDSERQTTVIDSDGLKPEDKPSVVPVPTVDSPVKEKKQD